MVLLAHAVRILKKRPSVEPSMVMIDAQVVRGGRFGPTFHNAGGRGGRTIGAERSILIEILGLPLAVRVDPASPHDVKVGRELPADSLPAPPRVQAIPADRGYRGLARLERTSRSTSRLRRRSRRALRQSVRPTRSSTLLPDWDDGGGCRAVTREPKRARELGSKSRRSPTCLPGFESSRPDFRRASRH